MKINVNKTVEVTLKLNRKEAEWLKSIVQNPIGRGPIMDESRDNKRMREVFWNALSQIEED